MGAIEMVEYRIAVYTWKGAGLTQEISSLRIDGQEQQEWKGKLWIDFLNQSARDGWEIVAVAPLDVVIGQVYFKRARS
ncbi:MAG: hypothetical protein F6K28_42230 [Microcoleus sp. SIO2G3]|nr:hypothetical protein [Microcoleus sp. SIO2G3]